MTSNNDFRTCNDKTVTSANSPTIISSNEEASVTIDDSCILSVSFRVNEDTSYEKIPEEAQQYLSFVASVERSNFSAAESNSDDVYENCGSGDNNGGDSITIVSAIQSTASEDHVFGSMEVHTERSTLLDEEILNEKSVNRTIEESYFDADQFHDQCPIPVLEEEITFEEKNRKKAPDFEPSDISSIKTNAMPFSNNKISHKENDARRQSCCEPAAVMNSIVTEAVALSPTDVELLECKPSALIVNLHSKAAIKLLSGADLTKCLQHCINAFRLTSIPLQENSKGIDPDDIRISTKLLGPHGMTAKVITRRCMKSTRKNERSRKHVKFYHLREYRFLKRLIQENTIRMKLKRMLLKSAYIDLFLVTKKRKRKEEKKQEPTVHVAATVPTISGILCDDRTEADERLEKVKSAIGDEGHDSTRTQDSSAGSYSAPNHRGISTNLDEMYDQDELSKFLPSSQDQQSSTKFGPTCKKRTLFGTTRKPPKKNNQTLFKPRVTTGYFMKKQATAACYDTNTDSKKKNICARVIPGNNDKAFEDENDLESNEEDDPIEKNSVSFARNNSPLSETDGEEKGAERESTYKTNNCLDNCDDDDLDAESSPFLAGKIEDAESKVMQNNRMSPTFNREINLGGPPSEEKELNRMESSISKIVASRAKKKKARIGSCLCQMTCVIFVIIGIFSLGMFLGLLSQYCWNLLEIEYQTP